MPYIDATKAKQVVAIAKDYIGTEYKSFVDKAANGCMVYPNKWHDLLCFYQLYRIANHRIDDFINDATYQNIIVNLLGKIALTPNYSLATCNSNVINVNGGCGCEGGSSTTGPVSGCKDSILSFTLISGQTTISTPALQGVDILIAIREGVVMSAIPSKINGFIFDSLTGTFIANAPAGPSGEDFILLYRNCNSGGGIPIPPVGLRTGTATFNGNGVQTVFIINHGGTTIPGWYVVGGVAGVYNYTATSNNVIVTFDVAPPPGTNNIVLTWAVR